MLSAQKVSFAGASTSVNVGSANLCAAGQTTPAPCNQGATLVYHVTAGGTLGSAKVVTQGAPNLDFTLAGRSTCIGAVATGADCTVDVQFKPRFAGSRSGAVQITDASGNVLATTLIYGSGIGPQIGFNPGVQRMLPFKGSAPIGVAVDGSGNVFVADSNNSRVVELPSGGGAQVTLPFSGLMYEQGVAVDGAGHVLVADTSNSRVVALSPGAASQTVVPFTNLYLPTSLAVDDAGDIFVQNSNRGAQELKAGGSQIALPTDGVSELLEMTADGAGNAFIGGLNTANSWLLAEIPAGGAAPLTIGTGMAYSELAVDGLGDVFAANQGQEGIEEYPASGAAPFLVGGGNPNLLEIAGDAAGDIFATSYVSDASGAVGVVTEIDRTHPASLSFGIHVVGGEVVLPVTVVNTGTGTLTIDPSISNANFHILTPAQATCLAGMTSGETCTLQVGFSPSAIGSQTGTLTLHTNAAMTPSVAVGLQGTAIAAGPVESFDFSQGFSQAQGQIQFNGSTDLDGSRLQLTNGRFSEAGSAFYDLPVNVESFTTDFSFQLLSAVADGLTFTVQNAGLTALGNDGSGLGYATIAKSAAIKFDLYNNVGEGANSTGLFINGALPTTPSLGLTGTGITLNGQGPVLAHITYDGSNLNMTLSEGPYSWWHSFPINLPATVGNTSAYIGFTAGTGGKTADQEILSWSYSGGFPTPSVPDYPAGFGAGGMALNGNALISGTALQLAQGGRDQFSSAYYAVPANIQSFTTDFTFRVSDPAADGFTFTIQNEGFNALGGEGGALGYAGIGRSVAVKFDIYNNAGEGGNSTGLYVDGASPTVPALDLTGSGIDLHSQDLLAAHIKYDGTNLTLTLTDTATLATWSHTFAINIPATVGGKTAYVGFTGGTGGESSTPAIATWTFTNP